MLRHILAVSFALYGMGGFAQNCSLCVIDLSCDSVPANPKLCPAVLPTDTAQQYYETDVTFYMPQQFDITVPLSATVDLQQIEVIGLSGLPAGMEWTSYDYTGADVINFYPPSNPPLSERGCAKICGTPLLPGNYLITVSVLAYVDVAGQSLTQAQSFEVPLTIVPSPTGNSVFTMTNTQGCGSVTSSFAPILQSDGNPLYEYNWDFGDGTTSTSEFPDHTYATPGDYAVSMTMDIYEYVLTDVSASAIGTGWCGDVEELVCAFSSPDLYFVYSDSSSITQSVTVDDNDNPSWSGVDQVIDGYQFDLHFWDEDLISQFDDLGSVTVSFTGVGSPGFSNSEVQGFTTIIKQIDTSYTDYDTIHVYAYPNTDTIQFSLNDSVCTGDSVTLTTGGGAYYQWYVDTDVIAGATDSSYVTSVTGDFWATVSTLQGCIDTTNTQTVTIVPYNQKPSFFNNLNVLTTFSTAPNLQWYMNGVAVPGETGQTLEITQDGNYHLMTTNALGCVTSSDTTSETWVELVGIGDDLSVFQELKVYPNPNNGSFNVQFGMFETADMIISVRDLMGRVVFSEAYSSVTGLFTSKVELGNVSSGVYTVNVEIGNYTFYRKVLVK
ncbi:MAG: T9SS type A sorting domain-containing protein [Flavobacteriales bacterium]|nr:T9SS type A sorting domain-containing protein [Flavobacteriales bacterium]